LKSNCLLVLDVRTFAHRSWMLRLGNIFEHLFCFSCLGFHKKPKAVQTVKLTFHNRGKPLGSRYAKVDPSKEPNRPHISSVTTISKSTETKQTVMRPVEWRAPPAVSLVIILRLVALLVALQPVWRPACASLRWW